MTSAPSDSQLAALSLTSLFPSQICVLSVAVVPLVITIQLFFFCQSWEKTPLQATGPDCSRWLEADMEAVRVVLMGTLHSLDAVQQRCSSSFSRAKRTSA